MARRILWGALVALSACGRAAAEEPRTDGSADFRRVVREAKDRVFPAVLFIRCIREENDEGKKGGAEISGSGVLVSPTGEFVTNWHVLDRAREVRCLLADGRAYGAEIVGTDKDTDVGLGRLKAPAGTTPFPYAAFGDSDALVEGDFVMAMGAPWGMSRSVSIGIVACTRRYLEENSEYSLWLQTDASISPGNSGGPLVNTRGQVVGLNARGIMRGGDLGFAVPSSTVVWVVEQLRAHGRVPWAWTGVRLQPLRDFDSDTYFEGKDGVIVAGTDPDSPAAKAGLQAQDRLLAVNGRALAALTVEDLPAAHRTLGSLPHAKPAVFRVRRGEQELEVSVVPREKGEVLGEECSCSRFDFAVKAINQFEHPALFVDRQEGVFVYGVRSPGNARAAHLRRGDILLKIGATEVRTVADVRAAHAASLAKVATEPRVVLTILRGGLRRQVVLDFARDYERE
jgi:serine protease Do